VQVGHSTIIQGSGRLRTGKGPVRTGVTAILPNRGNIFHDRLAGGGFVLNGAGEVSGLTQVLEWGLIETPILLTNTLSVGTSSHGLVRYMVEKYPGLGREYDVVIPLVGECDDSWLNDIRGRHVRPEHVYEAINNAASGPVDEGNVGGGTGMITCDLKGGIGTSSRKLPPARGGYTLGVIVMSNFGRLEDLRIDGTPVGRILEPRFKEQKKRRSTYGSIIVVVGTDAPLISLQLNRLSKRAALGIGMVGSFAAHQSGEIILAFSTANVFSRHSKSRTYTHTLLSDEHIDPLYQAAIETTEEAILNALFMAEDMYGINDHFAPALPIEDVRTILTRYHIGRP
jgi:D-aminopeptidase